MQKLKSKPLNITNTDEIKVRLSSRPKKRLEIFRAIEPNLQGFILLGLSKHIQEDVLSRLTDKEVIKTLNYLDPDDSSDLLQILDLRRSKRIAIQLKDSLREKVEFLLKFHPKTAAGTMTLDYIEVDKNSTFGDVAKSIIDHEQRTGKFPTVLAVDNGYLMGEIAGHDLVVHSPREKVENFVRKVPAIKYDADQREVVNTFVNHPHNKIVVLDEEESILGVIHSDDILRVIDKESTHDLYGFAGVSREEDVWDPAVEKVRYRYKWLIINLGTAFLAASVVSLFEDTISKFVLLAVYMPIVAGMGGNAGTQTLAVTVRGLALKEIELKTSKRVILNEMLAGATNGVINGIIVAVIATFWNQSPMLGVVIGTAMVINLIIAGFFGTLIPLIMKKLGKDPAASATIFITTATDVIGFFVFLGLASVILV